METNNKTSLNDNISIDIQNNINNLNISSNNVKFNFKDVNEIIINFINSLSNKKVLDKINKIGLHFEQLTLHFWFEIKDDDEDTENEIIRAEAELSAFTYKHYMVDIDTMILEESDKLNIPNHYKTIK